MVIKLVRASNVSTLHSPYLAGAWKRAV